MSVAITREVSPSIARCELSFREREPIDPERAAAQHEAYCKALAALGLDVIRLEADEAHPDACFVEDVAIVLDELAVLTLPGAVSRRGERAAVEAALRAFRRIERLELPATLDGGDVLRMGRTLFVGVSRRTNAHGIQALGGLVAPFGYTVVPVPVHGCLHLKSAVTRLDDASVLANPELIDASALAALELVAVPAEEPEAANVLAVAGHVLVDAGHPRTLERLARRGLRPLPLDVSEFAKAEGGLTCKSLIFER